MEEAGEFASDRCYPPGLQGDYKARPHAGEGRLTSGSGVWEGRL